MADNSKLLEIISQFYTAAEQPLAWNDALATVARVLKSSGVHLVGIAPKDEILFSFAPGLDPSMVAEFPAHIAEDVRLQALRKAAPLDVCVDYQHTSESEMDAHPYYAGYLAKYGQRYYAGATLFRDADREVMIAVLRNRDQGPFQKPDVDVLSMLLPNLKQAVEIGIKIETLQTRLALGWSALQRMKLGVVAVRSDGVVLLATDAARRMGSANDGLILSRHGLQAQRRSDDQKLQRLIAKGLQIATGDKHIEVGHAEMIARSSGRTPYIASVFPWRSPEAQYFGSKPTALVILRDPSATPPQSEEQIAGLLGLTPAEARLAKQLVEGATLQIAAKTLGISPNTARTQLRSIFRKTDTRRQAELLRLLTLSLGTSLR